MTLRHPLTSVIRLRREKDGEDRYGDPTYAETETELPPALFQPGAMVEALERGRESIVLAPTVFWRKQFPDVKDTDRLIILGETYRIIGRPQQWRGNKSYGLVVQLQNTKDVEQEAP